MTLHDFMVGPEGAQESGPDRPRLVRLVSGVSGRVPMIVTIDRWRASQRRSRRPRSRGGE